MIIWIGILYYYESKEFPSNRCEWNFERCKPYKLNIFNLFFNAIIYESAKTIENLDKLHTTTPLHSGFQKKKNGPLGPS